MVPEMTIAATISIIPRLRSSTANPPIEAWQFARSPARCPCRNAGNRPIFLTQLGEMEKFPMSIDDLDRRILALLQRDARMPVKALAEQVGLSSPAASERLRRLEERGVIRAFTVDAEPRALGYPMQAIVRIRPLPGSSSRCRS